MLITFNGTGIHPLHALGSAPAVGGPNGAQPSTANDRFMEGFGSVDWPEPLIPTDQQVNGPKGALWSLNDPIEDIEIGSLGERAVRTDNPQDADALLQSVRIVSLPSKALRSIFPTPRLQGIKGFAIFEYMNNPDFIARFNLARNQVRTQFGIIERAFAAQGWHTDGIQECWDVVLNDFMLQLETRVQVFTSEAIAEAFNPYNTATGPRLTTYNQVRTTLLAWQRMLDNGSQGLTLNFQYFVNPQPPPGSGSP